MRRFLTNAWTVGIGSTAIGTALVTWRWPDVRPSLMPVRDAFVDTAGYLAGTVHVHRSTLLILLVGLLVFAVVLAHVAVWFHRAQAVRAQSTTPPQLPAGFKPTERQAAALAQAFALHPHAVDLPDIAVALRNRIGLNDATQAHAERVLDELCKLGAMRLIDPAFHQYHLTPAGLDYCRGWDDWARNEKGGHL